MDEYELVLLTQEFYLFQRPEQHDRTLYPSIPDQDICPAAQGNIGNIAFLQVQVNIPQRIKVPWHGKDFRSPSDAQRGMVAHQLHKPDLSFKKTLSKNSPELFIPHFFPVTSETLSPRFARRSRPQV